MRFVGKPTLDNKEVCSDQDTGLDVCDGATSEELWAGREQATGKEEAEVIRGILVEMANSDLRDVVLPVPAPSGGAPPIAGGRCRASDLLQWKDAEPVGKRKLIDYCHAPVDSPDPGPPQLQ